MGSRPGTPYPRPAKCGGNKKPRSCAPGRSGGGAEVGRPARPGLAAPRSPAARASPAAARAAAEGQKRASALHAAARRCGAHQARSPRGARPRCDPVRPGAPSAAPRSVSPPRPADPGPDSPPAPSWPRGPCHVVLRIAPQLPGWLPSSEGLNWGPWGPGQQAPLGLSPSPSPDGAVGLGPRLFPEPHQAPPGPPAGAFVSAAPHRRAARRTGPSRAATAPARRSRAPALRGLTRLVPRAPRAPRPAALYPVWLGFGWGRSRGLPPLPTPPPQAEVGIL